MAFVSVFNADGVFSFTGSIEEAIKFEDKRLGKIFRKWHKILNEK